MDHDSEFDIVVWGATGFTGRLTAEKLAARHGGPVKGGGGAFELRDAAREFFLPLRERLGHAVGRTRFEAAERSEVPR